MRHRPILGDRFRVRQVTDELASQVVQLFGASAPDRPERSLDDARGTGVDWDADVLPKMSARKEPHRPAEGSDCSRHPEELRCYEGRVFVEDGLASRFKAVLHASGVELQGAIPIGAAALVAPSEKPLPSAPASSSTAPLPAASASSVAAVVPITIQSLDVTTNSLTPEVWRRLPGRCPILGWTNVRNSTAFCNAFETTSEVQLHRGLCSRRMSCKLLSGSKPCKAHVDRWALRRGTLGASLASKQTTMVTPQKRLGSKRVEGELCGKGQEIVSCRELVSALANCNVLFFTGAKVRSDVVVHRQ